MPGPLFSSSVPVPFTTTKLALMRGITMRPTAPPAPAVLFQLAGQKRHPPLLIGQAGERSPLNRRGGGVFDRVQRAREVVLAELAVQALSGSCQTSVTPASINASAPNPMSANASSLEARWRSRPAGPERALFAVRGPLSRIWSIAECRTWRAAIAMLMPA